MIHFTMEDGVRAAFKGNINIDRERLGIAESDWLLSLAKQDIRSGRVLHLGGGFCCMAWVMGPAFDHTIVEIEPEMAQFAPPFAETIVGDASEYPRDGYDIVIVTYQETFMEIIPA